MAAFTSDDIDEFLRCFPGFIKSQEQDKICLSGTATIDADGESYNFEVKICPSKTYPYRFPRVFELSDKIKKIADWHINSDESFCHTVEPIETIACKEGISLTKFYSNWLIPYLANQQYRINEGKYANGEYSHNVLGLWEYYKETLNTENIYRVEKCLHTALTTKKIERTSFCYCGSGIKYRNCHKEATIKLWQSGDELLAKHLDLFKSIILKL